MPQQAFSPSYRSPRAGYRQRGSSSLYYTDGSKTGARIDGRPQAARMMGGPSEGPLAPRGNQFLPNRPKTRQDNIDAARADGTFDAKRAAFNAANKGSYMDERGTIGPKAPLPTGNPANERVPVVPTTPSTPAAAKPQIMGPPRPATFEGKSRADWFGAAAKRQGQSNAYSGEALAQAKTPEPTQRLDRQKEVSVTPAAVAATPKPAPAPTSQTPAGVPKPTFDDPDAKDRYNNAMASLSPDALKPAPGSPAQKPLEDRAAALGNAAKLAAQGNQIVANLPKTPSSPNEQGVSTSYTTKETRPGDIDVVPKVKPPTSPNAQGLSDVIAKRQSQTAAPVNKLPPQPGIIRDDNPAPSSNASWFSSASKSLTQGAQTMMNDRAAKMQNLADLENRAKPGTTKIVEGATDAAKTVGKAINEGIPKVANTITTGMEDTAKAAIAKAKEVTAPARTWLTGDKNAAAEAAKLKAEINPPAPKVYVPTYTGGDNPPVPTAAMDDKKKQRQVATR